MENMEGRLNEIETRLNEMDELTQASAKLIKVLSEEVMNNAQNISETGDRMIKLAKMILTEKEQVNSIIQQAGLSDNLLSEKDPEEKKTPVEEDESDNTKYLVWGEYTIHPKYHIPILEMRIRHGEDGEEKRLDMYLHLGDISFKYPVRTMENLI